MAQELYMNNSGHRWTYIEKETRQFYLLINGKYVLRVADFFEALGNFILYNYRVKGKRFTAFTESCESYNDLPIVIHSKSA